jgi:hypothetical protein
MPEITVNVEDKCKDYLNPFKFDRTGCDCYFYNICQELRTMKKAMALIKGGK